MHACKQARRHVHVRPSICPHTYIKYAQTLAVNSTDPDNTATQTTTNAIGWLLVENILCHCCRGNSRKEGTEMEEVWFLFPEQNAGRVWAGETDKEEKKGIADKPSFIKKDMIPDKKAEMENPSFQTERESVCVIRHDCEYVCVCACARVCITTGVPGTSMRSIYICDCD